MLAVGGFGSLVVGDEDEGVGNDVGERVHRVGDEALRMRNEADDELHGGEHDIDRDANPGNAPALAKALLGLRAGAAGEVWIACGSGFARHRGGLYSLPRIVSPRPRWAA